VTPGTYYPTIDSSAAPQGTHLKSGSIYCTVDSNLTVTCPQYTLAGVGNTNADVLLTANYTATIDCYNPGTNPNNPIESHTTTYSPKDERTEAPTKNGNLTVHSKSVSFANAPVGCPNPNWTPVVRSGSVVLQSFSYTVTFAGFSSPYATISATDP
jgi:hypothetical protein